MTADSPSLPLSFDPLIAEAKQRMRRRRVGLALLVLVAGAVTLAFELWPSGTPAPARSSAHVQAPRQLARVTVPVDSYEREWRGWVVRDTLTRPLGVAKAEAARRGLERYASSSGLRIVRLKVWRTTRYPSIELVLATSSAPAVFLRRDFLPLMSQTALRSASNFGYLKIVDRHGASFLESGKRPLRFRSGFAEKSLFKVPRRLQGCSPAVRQFGPTPPPCPAQ